MNNIESRTLALKIAQSPRLQAAYARVEELFRADPAARTPDGIKTLQRAVREHFYAAIQRALNSDPDHPAVTAISLPRHTLAGQEFPAAHHGGMQNPDVFYRLVPIGGTARYALHGVRPKVAPAQVVFELLDAAPGLGDLGQLGRQLAVLQDRDMQFAPDGSFTITLDAEPAGDRPNHMQTTPAARALLIRDVLSDWSTQQPFSLHIERLDPPTQPARSEAQLLDLAVEMVPRFADFWLRFRAGYLQQNSHRRVNVLDVPEFRTGGWGFISNTSFELADDEALIMTLDPLGARYFSVMLADPWFIVMDSERRSGSLNNSQARANADGSFTVVIAPRDTGACNWLDTEGLNTGYIQVRWQEVPATLTSAAGAIRSVQRLPITELGSALPDAGAWVKAIERKAQLATRFATFERRLSVL